MSIPSLRPLITEYLVNIYKRRAFWSLNKDILKINDSDYQYAVSIKEDAVYPCLHSPNTTKETSSIRLDTAYWCDPIRRIELASASTIVEIYLTWSLSKYRAYGESTVFREPPYQFDYPTRRLTMEEILAKFIDEVQIPKYAKYLKSLLTNKSRLEKACTETINERCSAVFLNELPSKEKDPRSFTTPCQVFEKPKEAEDLATDLLSRFQKPHMEVLTEREITDKFFDKHLMVLKSKFNNDEPCYADFVNYCWKAVPLNWTFEKRKRFFSAIKCILERSVGYNLKGWSEKLNDALWAFRMAYKTPTGCTPFRLVYGKACHLPVEIKHKAHWELKQCNMDLMLASKSRLMQLNELAELRDGVYENTKIYKEWTKKWHASRLYGDKDFKVGDKVLLYNSRLKMYPGKLKSKWSGPNIVKMVYPHGAIEITDRDGVSFKVNGQRLKKYYEGNIEKEDDEVLEFEDGVT
ncbi:reverse transcriptase domain-containing protein [Tanacetum coccineum]